MNDLSEVAIDTVSCDSNRLWCWFNTNVQTNIPFTIPIMRNVIAVTLCQAWNAFIFPDHHRTWPSVCYNSMTGTLPCIVPRAD